MEERSISRFNSTTFALAVILAGFLCSMVIVHADNVSTAVTVGNAEPTITNLTLNSGNDITLTENTFTFASSSMTVTDSNGCSEISSVTAKLYRSTSTTEGTNCTADDTNCYDTFGSCAATSTGDTCDGGSDTAVEYDCAFKIWYIADPTDAGDFSNEVWVVAATTTDGADTTSATNTSETVEIDELNALDVTSSISYGSVSPNTNTGASNQSTTLTNTGNTAIDSEIGGDVMCTDYNTCSGDSMTPDQQKFDTSDVTYASLSNTLAATASPATIEVDLAKPSATTSSVTDLLYWGIAIPDGQPTGSYTGQNTASAVSD